MPNVTSLMSSISKTLISVVDLSIHFFSPVFSLGDVGLKGTGVCVSTEQCHTQSHPSHRPAMAPDGMPMPPPSHTPLLLLTSSLSSKNCPLVVGRGGALNPGIMSILVLESQISTSPLRRAINSPRVPWYMRLETIYWGLALFLL